MSNTDEHQVLQWFEQALDFPPPERRAWLAAQGLPEWLQSRVQRLLDIESSMGGFLEHPAVPPAPDGFPQLGERLGHFELVSRIDSGGMGVVYLARRADNAYEQQVALKLIRPLHLGAGSAFRHQLVARFENERALLARLSHPNIARILDGGSTGSGIPWLAMEYIDGTSLIEYCDRNGLDVAARLRLFRKVCDGVQEAHRNLIVHRDLKPENILVDANGEPRLLDFGIARLLEAEDPHDVATLTSLTAMTPAYASPEQVRREPATTRSDVYSLGVMLYQLLTGVAPYQLAGLSPAQAERTICEAHPRPLRDAVGDAPADDATRQRWLSQLHGDLDTIVTKAMHKDIERRYGSAQELADDLQRYLEGRPVLAHPDSSGYRIGKFIGRHRTGAVLASLALLGMVGASGVALWQAHQAERAAEDTRRINAFLLDVMSMSDPFEAGGELSLSQALDKAADRIEDYFPDRPDLSADVRYGIGYSMVGRHRLAQAEVQLTRALRDSEREFGMDDARTIRVLEGLAGLRQEQGRVSEAESLYLDGIARSARGGLQADPIHLYLVNNLGLLYMAQDRHEEAATMLEQGKALWDAHHATGKPDLDHANLLSNLAQVAHARDDLDRAEALYRDAQAELALIHPQGSPDTAIAIGNRGMLAEERGHLEEALDLYLESLAIRERMFANDHPSVVVGLSNVARMSVATDRVGPALAAAERAVAMADRIYTEPGMRHASTLATLAEARLANGDPDGAIAALQRAYELTARIDSPTPSLIGYIARIRDRTCASADAATAICVGPPPSGQFP